MMKYLPVLVAAIALCAGNSVPAEFESFEDSFMENLIPGNNSHYMEGQSNYIWMPDGNGVPHLINLAARPSEHMMSSLSFPIQHGVNNQYWLYTRKNPREPQIIRRSDNDVPNSNYDGSKPLKVVVHGYLSDGTSHINPLLTASFLANSDCNVIVVDWRALANSLYWTSVWGVPSVGTFLGRFLDWLISTHGGNWDDVHLVGFSLGAHIVGNAGRTVGKIGKNKVGRITGLDPAGPMWNSNPYALHATDAQYVECIHTDGGVLGIFEPIGHVNFYPNGGRNAQPGCWISTCSHGRAYQLMAASIHYDYFTARRCPNLDVARNQKCDGSDKLKMGNADSRKRGHGIFGVQTTDSWPFHGIQPRS